MKAKRTYETNSIIVTVFEPWRKRKKNISLEVLKNIIEKNIQGVSCLALPTIFSDFKIEIDYIKNFKPDYILSLGESGNKKVELEKKAKNLINCMKKGKKIPDNNGRVILDEKIIEEGMPFYPTTLPYKNIINHAKKQGYGVYESSNAGSHVCNFLYYKLLHEFKGLETKVGFLHLSRSEDVGKLTDLTYFVIDYLKKYPNGGKK